MRKYTEEHEYIIVLDGNKARVGITDYAQLELGEIVFVDIPTVGETLNAMDVFGSVEAVKTVADLYMPVSGTVVTMNTDLDEHPEFVNDGPYGTGWMIEIEMSDASELDNLMTEEEYLKFINH